MGILPNWLYNFVIIVPLANLNEYSVCLTTLEWACCKFKNKDYKLMILDFFMPFNWDIFMCLVIRAEGKNKAIF